MSFRLFLLFVLICHFTAPGQVSSSISHHKRQFRGVWIASVRNLDWPSKPGLSNKRVKKEFIKQIDQLKDLGMNAVIVQIRPSGDVFYPSEFEPWSEFLTGKQGEPPSSSFDPLAFMIAETHKRAMEFHAWFNPYRAVRNIEQANLSPKHMIFQHPDWFVVYGKDAYFDPGMVPARKFVEKVIADVVTRYDIDAVHFDDYYYPYRLEGIEFPDSLSFLKYGGSNTKATKGDWRRTNINLLVRELYDTINYLKPWVHFGISPFGVWRNKSMDPEGSDTETLQTNYDDLYGDALAWLRNGWLDYIIPQCYQYLGRDIMDYRVVTRWWSEHHHGVNFYIGQGPFKLGDPIRGKPWTVGNEIARQLYFNDSIPDLLGSAYFRSMTFMENPLGVNDSLKNKFYKYPAVPPASHHDTTRVSNLQFTTLDARIGKRKVTLNLQVDFPEQARYFVLYRNENHNDPENILLVTADKKIKLKIKSTDKDPSGMYITIIDRFRKESTPRKVVRNNEVSQLK